MTLTTAPTFTLDSLASSLRCCQRVDYAFSRSGEGVLYAGFFDDLAEEGGTLYGQNDSLTINVLRIDRINTLSGLGVFLVVRGLIGKNCDSLQAHNRL